MRSIDKALEAAGSEDNTDLKRALAEARHPIVEYLQAQGMNVAQRKGPRGRKAAKRAS